MPACRLWPNRTFCCRGSACRGNALIGIVAFWLQQFCVSPTKVWACWTFVTHGGVIMYKKLLLSGVAVLGFAGLANAADMAFKAPPAPIYVSTWTGCYIGGNVGYGRSTSSHLFSFDDVLTPGEFQFTDQFSPKGFLGGFQGGCQLQTGQFLWGLEGDWDSFKHTDSRSWADPGGGDSCVLLQQREFAVERSCSIRHHHFGCVSPLRDARYRWRKDQLQL